MTEFAKVLASFARLYPFYTAATCIALVFIGMVIMSLVAP